jgi:hypothetical protein
MSCLLVLGFEPDKVTVAIAILQKPVVQYNNNNGVFLGYASQLL